MEADKWQSLPARFFAQAARMGSRRLLLGVYEKNDRAIAFYERFGFARVGTRRFRVGRTDYDDLILGFDIV